MMDLNQFFPGSQYLSTKGHGCGGRANSPKNTNVTLDNDPMNKWGKDHCNAIGDGYGRFG